MTQKKRPKFLRRTWCRFAKLGKGRKKKQVWRRPTGRDNKMREKRGGYPAVVSVGYCSDKESYGKIKEKTPVMVYNIKDLEKVGKENIALIANVGKKKRAEIETKAKEMNIEISNKLKEKKK